MIIAHRCNDVSYVYMLYWKRGVRCFEIDVQTTKDGVLVVYHDDISHLRHGEVEALGGNVVYTLAEFLRCTPDDITLNVEIKNYAGKASAAKAIIDTCERATREKRLIYSSFDQDVVTALANRGLTHWILFEKYAKRFARPHICVDIRILDKVLERDDDTTLSVYGLQEKDMTRYVSNPRYKKVQNWIMDYLAMI